MRGKSKPILNPVFDNGAKCARKDPGSRPSSVMQAAFGLGHNETADGRMKCRTKMSPPDDPAQEALRHGLIDFAEDLQKASKAKAMLLGHPRRRNGVCLLLHLYV